MTEDTAHRVLEAAGPIFAEKGYEAATVREICTRAGVNVASVNYHFGDKQQLYLDTVTQAHTLLLEEVPPARWPPDASPPQKLAAFIHAMLTRMLGQQQLGWQVRLLVREMLDPTIACKPLVRDFIRPQLDQLLEILDELLPASVDEQRRYQMAFSIVGQCLHYRVAREFVALLIPHRQRTARYSIDQLAGHITDFSLAALAGISRSAGRPSSGKRTASRRRLGAAES